jgi:hypothetical protein
VWIIGWGEDDEDDVRDTEPIEKVEPGQDEGTAEAKVSEAE